jgi:hypothetical protein
VFYHQFSACHALIKAVFNRPRVRPSSQLVHQFMSHLRRTIIITREWWLLTVMHEKTCATLFNICVATTSALNDGASCRTPHTTDRRNKPPYCPSPKRRCYLSSRRLLPMLPAVRTSIHAALFPCSKSPIIVTKLCSCKHL